MYSSLWLTGDVLVAVATCGVRSSSAQGGVDVLFAPGGDVLVAPLHSSFKRMNCKHKITFVMVDIKQYWAIRIDRTIRFKFSGYEMKRHVDWTDVLVFLICLRRIRHGRFVYFV